MMEFLSTHATYVVLACALVIWLGIALYLWRIDSSLAALETTITKK